MTDKEKRLAVWKTIGTVRPVGSDREWIEQRDQVSGKKRFISYSRSGREVIRYGSPRQ